MRRFSTAVTITDPLVRYQTHVASGLYAPDHAQHRLARHLHKIYLRIKDYSPQSEYRQRLQRAARLAEPKTDEANEDEGRILARRGHSIWRNPLFSHLLTTPEGRESVALTRVLTNHEAAVEIDSPKGLFLSGEVGTGKSMLLDLLADGLPTDKKRRWHFNTFMLYTISQLEHHRKSSTRPEGSSEYSILWMAKKLVDESPILFLDEFQLPDRAASKILSNLFIAFFQLGGVLVASSNRVPEELQRATGVDYTPAPSRGLIRNFFGGSRTRSCGDGELYGATSDFANFLEVLKARCDFWQMEGAKDWRRKEEVCSPEVIVGGSVEVSVEGSVEGSGEGPAGPVDDASPPKPERRRMPVNYHLSSSSSASWDQLVKQAMSWTSPHPPPWKPSTLVVYGREVRTPRHHAGFVLWDFEPLVESFGPADYITMASTYHTFIVDGVPVLTHDKKNEARRFITLLDALYEARCKLVVRAQNPPDVLFFPTTRSKTAANKTDTVVDDDDDATYSETIAEVYQDQVSPFRPNVSYYDTQSGTRYDPDQDSDFGLPAPQRPAIDFANRGAFTGEDERFAYKRAVSRLWELCGGEWHARTGDWWRPLPLEARHWEGGEVSARLDQRVGAVRRRDKNEAMGESVKIDEVAGLSKWRVEHLKRESQ